MGELLELIAMFMVEKKVRENDDFYEYFLQKANKKVFNNRYKELLDKFLNLYALNKTEKSEENN